MSDVYAFEAISPTYPFAVGLTASAPVQILPAAGQTGQYQSYLVVNDSPGKICLTLSPDSSQLAAFPAAAPYPLHTYILEPGVGVTLRGASQAYVSVIGLAASGTVYVTGGDGIADFSSDAPYATSTSSGSLTTADVSGGGATPTPGSALTVIVPPGTSASALQLSTNDGFTGTVVFESMVGDQIYNARVQRATGVLNKLDTSTSSFPYEGRGNVAGMQQFRVRVTQYGGTGTLKVTINLSSGVGAVFLNAPIPIGAQSAGNTWTNQSVAAGATWPASPAYEDTTNVADMSLVLTFTQASNIHLKYSQDGSNLFQEVIYAAWPANTPFTLSPTSGRGQFFAVQVENTSGSPGTLNQEVVYRATAKGDYRVALGNTSTQLKDANLTAVVKSVMAARNGPDAYVDAKIGGGTAGALQILRAAGITGTAGGQSGTTGTTVSVPSGAILTEVVCQSGSVAATVTMSWITGGVSVPGSNQAQTQFNYNPVPGTVVGPVTVTLSNPASYLVGWVVPD